jgi:hypothetical protein
MIRSISLSIVFLLCSLTTVFAQKDINSYKYIIVPIQYEFQKSEDQYQINSLTEFLFNKEGFTAVFSNSTFPDELALNACSALKAVLVSESGLFTTKIKINLVDCYNAVVFSTDLGTSKLKDYKKAYHEAIRNAFADIQALNYVYNGSNNLNTTAIAAVSKSEPQQTQVASKAEAIPSIEASAPIAAPAVSAPVVAESAAVETKKEVATPEVTKSKVYTIEGTYFMDIWGNCVIEPKGDGYAVIGGDENYEFATITKTSKPNIFIVKKTGFSNTQLLELAADGNLQIDTKNGIKIYKRVE